MEPSLLLGLGVLAIVLLAVLLFAASVPLVWFLIAAALFFSGLIGPAMGCLVLGLIASAFAYARGN